MDALKLISESSMKSEVPAFEVGDTVKVHVRIKEGQKYRIQVFEGTVIAKRHGGIQETFTAAALREFSLYILPLLTRLRSLDTVRLEEASFTTSETESARLPRSRRTFSNPAAQYLYMMKGIRLLSINLKKQCRVGLFELARSV